MKRFFDDGRRVTSRALACLAVPLCLALVVSGVVAQASEDDLRALFPRVADIDTQGADGLYGDAVQDGFHSDGAAPDGFYGDAYPDGFHSDGADGSYGDAYQDGFYGDGASPTDAAADAPSDAPDDAAADADDSGEDAASWDASSD